MKLFSIAIKDTKVLIRDWKALAILLAMPFILISLLGMALGSVWAGESGISKFDVGVVNADKGELAKVFITDVLKSPDMAKMLNVSEVSESEARTKIESGDLAAAVIIPEGFTKKVMSGQNATMEVFGDPGQEVRAGIIRSIANAYASRLSSVMIGASVPVGALIQAGAVPPDRAVALGQELATEARKASENPQITVAKGSLSRERELTAIEYYSAGMSVMFLMFGSMYGAFSLLDERRQFTLMRLMSTPTSRLTILGGKLAGIFLIGVLQFSVLVLITRVIYGVKWGPLPEVATLMAATVLATTGLAIFISTIGKTQGAVAGISQLIIQPMAVLGGSMIPLIAFPPWLQTVSKFTINYWAISGFRDLMLGKGFESIVQPALILIIIAAVFMALGVWRFTYE
ncbi:MAG: ABC transporter permease [Actinomycetota bacterium]